MRLRNLVQDDDAVSPVIGVILMVAITVILAAVIASFVLGLGNQAGGVAPNADFEFNYDSSNTSGGTYGGSVTITHTSGDAVRQSALYVRGNEIDQDNSQIADSSATFPNQWTAPVEGSKEGESAIQAGDQAVIMLEPSNPSQYVVRLIWEDPDGDTTSQLAEDRGPNAS